MNVAPSARRGAAPHAHLLVVAGQVEGIGGSLEHDERGLQALKHPQGGPTG